jgi:hypothetical protein
MYLHPTKCHQSQEDEEHRGLWRLPWLAEAVSLLAGIEGGKDGRTFPLPGAHSLLFSPLINQFIVRVLAIQCVAKASMVMDFSVILRTYK